MHLLFLNVCYNMNIFYLVYHYQNWFTFDIHNMFVILNKTSRRMFMKSANKLLLEFQSDILGVTIERPECVETTALGVAYINGLWEAIEKNETR